MNEIELKKRAQRMATRLTDLGFTKEGKPMVIDQAYELVAAGEGLRNQHVLRVIAKKASSMDAAVATFGQGVFDAGYRPTVSIPPLTIPRLPDDAFIEALLVEAGPHTDIDVALAYEAWDKIVAEASRRAGVDTISAESEEVAYRAWETTVNQMHWDRDSEIVHLEGFLREAGLMGEFAKYAKRAAAEEIDSCDLDTDGHPAVKTPVTEVSNPNRALLESRGYVVKISDLKRPYWECGNEASDDFETEAQAWADANAHAVAVQSATASADQSSSQPQPAINKATYSDYAFSLGALTRDQLSELVEDTDLCIKHWSTADIRSHLLQVYENEFRSVAQAAYENYDFGNEEVEDSSGAEYAMNDGIWRKPVFLRPPMFLSHPGTIDTRKVTFTVTIRGLKVVDSKVIED